ncbi:hypothetical protein CIPAW_08G124100 [Carya illinoinensis]|uniref:40S ribosomal protein S3a n=1 Tax=Carya illinoinensis TaxID=32201 RepID=A0A8T1PMG6_CARIL|nr:hypothetical protein CIPAW_08G124100 [Carya illinoinensis]
MVVGKNKTIPKGRKAGKKKAADPFVKKDWYDIKAPSVFAVKNVGKTLVTHTQGTKGSNIVSEVSMADLQDDEDHAYRKIRLRAEDVQGKNTMIEAHVDVKTTDYYGLRMFCNGFNKRRQNEVKRTYNIKDEVHSLFLDVCFYSLRFIANSMWLIRRKMREIMINQASSCDPKELIHGDYSDDVGVKVERPTDETMVEVSAEPVGA